MLKEIFVFDRRTQIPKKATIRNYNKDDFHELIDVQKQAFPPPFPSDLWWNKNQLMNHVHKFQEGALCIEIDDNIVGSLTGLIVEVENNVSEHTWAEITDNGYIRNHNPFGNTFYVVDICVSPPYRSFGLGKWLMQTAYEVVVKLDLDRLLGGGRMPNFHKYEGILSPEEYVENVTGGKIYDPVISFLLKAGRTPVKPIKDYLEDEESCNYGLLMEWKNPFK